MHGDTELLTEFARTRSEQAFRRLVERYGGTVHSICYRRLRDPHLAEDAAQMVFATLAQKAGSITPDMLGPWLYQTAHFIANRVAIKRDRGKRRDLRSGAERRQSCEPPDRLAIVELVDRNLSRLDEKYRDALVLRYIEEKSVMEVAEALQVNTETAKKRLARGLSRLRQLMSESGVVASAAVVQKALSRIGEGKLPSGFTDRLVEKLGKKGLFGNGEAPRPPSSLPKLPLIITATTAVTLVGAVTIWWTNLRPTPPAAPTPMANAARLSPIQRLNKRVARFESATDMQGVITLLIQRTDEKFDVKWDLLRERGVMPDSPVIDTFDDGTLEGALNRMFRNLGHAGRELRYIVEADRIVITVGPPAPSSVKKT